jgi:uncharacterized protein (DUF433 family)
LQVSCKPGAAAVSGGGVVAYGSPFVGASVQVGWQRILTQANQEFNTSDMCSSVIVRDPEVMWGQPCFRGTRVPFKNLIDWLEAGDSLEKFLQDFPSVSREMAFQALEEAKDSLLAHV